MQNTHSAYYYMSVSVCVRARAKNVITCPSAVCVCVCVWARVCGRRVCFAANGARRVARFTSRAEFVAKANEKRKQTEADVELFVASAPYELMYIDNNG